MNRVTSKDGTSIAYERSGGGPAVVLVGGGLDDGSENAPLAPELAEHFTVYNYARRGRGDSGDTLPYAVEREIEDIEVLIAEAGGRRTCTASRRVVRSRWRPRQRGSRSTSWRCTTCRTAWPTMRRSGGGSTSRSWRRCSPRVVVEPAPGARRDRQHIPPAEHEAAYYREHEQSKKVA